ncbi:MAG: hypothetical protein U5J83_15030 [Bryobacterales bacterium]|nr:hypothetical protein [Bryobacterales bacterium]
MDCAFVRLCYREIVRTTLDIPDEPYYIAKAIARDRNRSLGHVVGDLILEAARGSRSATMEMSDYAFPTFRVPPAGDQRGCQGSRRA